MFQKALTYLQYGNHFCGIEHTAKDDKEVIYTTVLKKAKKTLDLEVTYQSKSIEEISNKLSKKAHVVLIVNNNKVLSKQIESNQNDNLKLVYKAFPNINLDDFYFEILSEKTNHFVSLCRKDYVDSIIETYSKNNVAIIDFTLGNNIVSVIKSFVNFKTIFTSNAIISIENKNLIQIKKYNVKNQNYDINGITVSNLNLLSFSGALQSVIKNNSTSTNFETEKRQLTDNYNQTRFFNVFLNFSGLFVLGLLLINFILFNNYFNKTNELKQISTINETAKNKIVNLNEAVAKKQKMVEDVLKSNTSKSSYYSSKVVESLPNTILLLDFNYQPLLKRIKANYDIGLNTNSIVISGTSSNSNTFSNWIIELEEFEWISKVSIINYETINNLKSNFSLNITVSDD